MKTNAPKRKVFQDAVDLISPPEEMINPVSSGQTMISVKKIGKRQILLRSDTKLPQPFVSWSNSL